MRRFLFPALFGILGGAVLLGQEPKYPPVRVPVKMVITVEARHGGIVPEIVK